MKNKILIVDDSREDRELLKEILEQASPSYEVWTVNSGKMALALIAQDPPDLVLLDIHMAEINGFETLKEMERRGHNMPVLLVSAFTDEHDRTQGVACGAVDFIDKPIKAEAVKARVAVHLKMNKLENKAGRFPFPGTAGVMSSPPSGSPVVAEGKPVLLNHLPYAVIQALVFCEESVTDICEGKLGEIPEDVKGKIVAIKEAITRLLRG